jgi:antitoxin component of RelBE/YafQ-DinJ toxin-antitoxin module
MPTEDMTTIPAKVRTDEKATFEQLCETEGLTPSKAIRSYVLACNERGAITEPEIQNARYMAHYGISQMR